MPSSGSGKSARTMTAVASGNPSTCRYPAGSTSDGASPTSRAYRARCAALPTWPDAASSPVGTAATR